MAKSGMLIKYCHTSLTIGSGNIESGLRGGTEVLWALVGYLGSSWGTVFSTPSLSILPKPSRMGGEEVYWSINLLKTRVDSSQGVRYYIFSKWLSFSFLPSSSASYFSPSTTGPSPFFLPFPSYSPAVVTSSFHQDLLQACPSLLPPANWSHQWNPFVRLS